MAPLSVRLGRALLRCLPSWARDAARGDLDEEYERIAGQRGPSVAGRWYAREALMLSLRYSGSRRSDPAAAVHGDRGRRTTAVFAALLQDVWSDLRYLARQMAARPGFWGAAIGTLGVAIGFNAAAFALVNAVLYKPLARHEADRVVRLYAQQDGRPASAGFSYPDYRLLRDEARIVKVAAVHLGLAVLTDGQRSDQLLVEIASGRYFDILGVPTIAGRTISELDDSRSSPPVALLSEHYWRNRFGADPAIVGRPVLLNGRSFTIAGIVGRFGGSFAGGGVDAWLPLEAALPFLGAGAAENRAARQLQLIGRLEPAVTPAQAVDALSAAAPELARLRNASSDVRLDVVPGTLLHGSARRMAAVLLSIFMALAGLLLLIAASNVANLQLARAFARRREMAIRLSLGAGRARVMRQLVTESMVVAGGGFAIGICVALWVSNAFRSVQLLPGVDLRLDLAPDARVLAVTLAAAVAAGLISTFVPALTSTRGSLVPFLREGGASIGSRRAAHLRSSLVAVQVAIAVMVCITAVLLAKSGREAAAIDPGFDRNGIFATDIDLDPHGYSQTRAESFYASLLSRVRELPGVAHATLASRAPLDSSTPSTRVLRGGEGMGPMAGTDVTYYVISADYFSAVGVPIAAGRALDDSDRAGNAQTAVVNETLVETMWPGLAAGDAIGRVLKIVPGAGLPAGEVRIVGVARDAKYRTLGEGRQPHFYLPYAQHYAPSMTLLVRARTAVAPMQDVQRAISALDPAVQGFFTRTMDEHTGVALLPARLAARVSTALAVVSALLGVIGLHGLITSLVTERRREFGLRMALGATSTRVSADVVRRALTIACWGAAAGALAALAGTQLLTSLLYGVSPSDPVTYALVISGAAAAAGLSAWLPARRASLVDPSLALRQ